MSVKEQIERLYDEGFNMYDIAAMLDVEVGSVSYVIYKYRKQKRDGVGSKPITPAGSKTTASVESKPKNNAESKAVNTVKKHALQEKVAQKVEETVVKKNAATITSAEKTVNTVAEKVKEEKNTQEFIKMSAVNDKSNKSVNKSDNVKVSAKAVEELAEIVKSLENTSDTETVTNESKEIEETINAVADKSDTVKSVDNMSNVEANAVEAATDGLETKDDVAAKEPQETVVKKRASGRYPKGTISDETLKIIKMFADGVDLAEIVKETKKSPTTLNRYMYKYMDKILEINPEFTTPNRKQGRPLGLKTVYENADEIIRKAACGESCADLAIEYKAQSVRSIKGFLLKNIQKIYEINPNFDVTVLKKTAIDELAERNQTEQRTQAILQCIANKEDFENIAKKFDIKAKSVYYIRRTHMAEILNINPNYITHKEKQILQCVANGDSIRDAAEKCEVIELTVTQVKARYAHVLPMLISRGMLAIETDNGMQTPIDSGKSVVVGEIKGTDVAAEACTAERVAESVTVAEKLGNVPEQAKQTEQTKQTEQAEQAVQARDTTTTESVATAQEPIVFAESISKLNHKEQLADIIYCIANKENLQSIAERFELSLKYIQKVRREYMDEILKINPNYITAEERQILVCVAKNVKFNDISVKYDVTKQDIYNLARKHKSIVAYLRELIAKGVDVNAETSTASESVLMQQTQAGQQNAIVDKADCAVVEDAAMTVEGAVVVNQAADIDNAGSSNVADTEKVGNTVAQSKSVVAVKHTYANEQSAVTERESKPKAVIRAVGVTETAKPAKKLRKLHSLWRQRKHQTLRNLRKLKKRRDK